MFRRIISAACAAALIATVGASAAFAGEFTGNGRSLHVDGGGKWGTGLHARSLCAFSGQEDLQFVDENDQPLPVAQKGVPGHAQSWGRIPKEDRDFLTSIGSNPGIACNPTKATGEPG
jgi:hypothetical protein